MKRVLEDTLGLQLSTEKTKITSFGKGYDFLGFTLSSKSRRMREKSVQKFKAKIRTLTVRKRNLDAEAVTKVNRVIRGTANTHGKARRVIPRHGATSLGVAR